MGRLPSIGTPVILRDSAENEYLSRLEGFDETTAIVASPTETYPGIVYDLGLELDVAWTHESGIHVVPSRLVASSMERAVRLWHLELVGESHTEQRRDYVRVPLTGSVTIEPVPTVDGGGLAGVQLAGAFIDLSEVALQAAVAVPDGWETIQPPVDVRCHFELGSNTYDLTGTIIIVRPGSSRKELRVVVRLDSSRAISDALRKEVFALQLARRKHRA